MMNQEELQGYEELIYTDRKRYMIDHRARLSVRRLLGKTLEATIGNRMWQVSGVSSYSFATVHHVNVLMRTLGNVDCNADASTRL